MRAVTRAGITNFIFLYLNALYLRTESLKGTFCKNLCSCSLYASLYTPRAEQIICLPHEVFYSHVAGVVVGWLSPHVTLTRYGASVRLLVWTSVR